MQKVKENTHSSRHIGPAPLHPIIGSSQRLYLSQFWGDFNFEDSYVKLIKSSLSAPITLYLILTTRKR